MTEIHTRIHRALTDPLETAGLELVDLARLPRSADPLVRLRNLQDLMADFEAQTEDGETLAFVVHVRAKEAPRAAPAESAPAAAPASPMNDSLYQTDGKLNSEYLLRNARVLLAAGDYALARQIYASLLKARDRTAEALYGVARCHEGEGRIEEALKRYEESALYHPSLKTYRRYAALLVRLGRNQHAAEVLERALNLKDLERDARFDLSLASGNCWLKAETPGKAERHYRVALDIRPESPEILCSLGAIRLAAQKLTEARDYFERAAQCDAKNAKAWTGIANCALRLGDKETAHDAFAESLALHPDNPTAIFHLVKCAYETRRYERACAILKDYLDSAPFNANLLYSLAGLQFHTNRLYEAEKTIEQILQIQPNHVESRALSAAIHRKRVAGANASDGGVSRGI